MDEAMRYWTASVRTPSTSSARRRVPTPTPMMVARLPEAPSAGRRRRRSLRRKGVLPDVLVACVGGGSNAMGLFFIRFRNDSGWI